MYNEFNVNLSLYTGNVSIICFLEIAEYAINIQGNFKYTSIKMNMEQQPSLCVS